MRSNSFSVDSQSPYEARTLVIMMIIDEKIEARHERQIRNVPMSYG